VVTDGAIDIQDVYGHRWPGIVAMFVPEKRIIYLNELHEYWRDPASYVRARYRRKLPWFSTGSKDHVTRHEIGHARHWDQFQASEVDRYWQGRFNLEDQNLIRKSVGAFAATTTEDFVAEVYAGLAARKTYPAEIMAIYERLKGPPL
jgi:hypothetical protein